MYQISDLGNPSEVYGGLIDAKVFYPPPPPHWVSLAVIALL